MAERELLTEPAVVEMLWRMGHELEYKWETDKEWDTLGPWRPESYLAYKDPHDGKCYFRVKP